MALGDGKPGARGVYEGGGGVRNDGHPHPQFTVGVVAEAPKREIRGDDA